MPAEKVSANGAATKVDSSAYYTFSALGFTLMMLSVGIAISIFDERENRTIERYRISKVRIGEMFAVKIIVGMIAGCIQFAVSFAFSAFVLGVEWGDKIGWMLLLLMLDNLFAVLLAVLLGISRRIGNAGLSLGKYTRAEMAG